MCNSIDTFRWYEGSDETKDKLGVGGWGLGGWGCKSFDIPCMCMAFLLIITLVLYCGPFNNFWWVFYLRFSSYIIFYEFKLDNLCYWLSYYGFILKITSHPIFNSSNANV